MFIIHTNVINKVTELNNQQAVRRVVKDKGKVSLLLS